MLIAHGPTGITHDFFVYNEAGEVWNGSGFVTWDDGDFVDYRITATEIGTSGRFTGMPPAGTAHYELRIRAATLADSVVVDEDQFLALNVAVGTELMRGRGPSGELHDFFAFNAANEVWYPIGGIFVSWVDANFTNYRIPATEIGTSGTFTATAPAGTETYELRIRAATLVNSAVMDVNVIEIDTSGAPLPPDPSQTTGFIKVYDNLGQPEIGVPITAQVADVRTQIESGGLTQVAGIALDSAPRISVSDSSGNVTFPGLFKGVVYTFKRGDGRPQTIPIPLTAGSTFQLPVLTGAED